MTHQTTTIGGRLAAKAGGAYYNEHDPNAAAWLANLGTAGLIPAGHVDARDIQEVTPDDVRGYGVCHWFAGIGGWPLALALAGWDATRPVWTASCPCQPFSAAGNGEGDADERNLWPEMFRLIRECRPLVVFGEQVEAAIGHGWLDGICADLEGEGYAVGSAVLGAHSTGAPQIRQRLYWVAYRDRRRCKGGPESHVCPEQSGEQTPRRLDAGGRGGSGGLAGDQSPNVRNGGPRTIEGSPGRASGRPTLGSWSEFDAIHCLDERWRRIEPGSFPLAPRIPEKVGPLVASLGELGIGAKLAKRIIREARRNRIARLRGFGNAIVPELAAEFIRAYMEVGS